MPNRKLLPCLFSLFLVMSVGLVQAASNERPKPRNVILIIGDGMDDHQITLARNYLAGAQGKVTLDEMAVRGSVQVLTVSDRDPNKAVYVGDSANTATAISTGTATSRMRIATSAQADKDLTTIVELATQQGFKTGIVTTDSVTGATPAAFASHVSLRFCKDPTQMTGAKVYDRIPFHCEPDMKRNGGAGSIAEQLAASDLDVLLGGGQKYFQHKGEDSSLTILEQAKANNFHLLTNSSELSKPQPDHKKLLGLFHEKVFPVQMMAEHERAAEQPDPSFLNYFHRYLGSVEFPEPATCVSNPAAQAVPTLKQMTTAALDKLSHNNDKGFFLMVESASIDKESHIRKPCGQIGELEQLLETVELARTFADTNPETLILVTADHGQAAQLVPDGSMYSALNVPVYSPGHIARVITPEGSVMAVNYATNTFVSEEHTGVNVPYFANRQLPEPLPTMLRQTELFNVMTGFMGIHTPQ
ncbi:alkaline phosphatase [Parendozoicomonas haliclonae]|uniref:Alkaline phosphatase n=1 Tax=Parendozoicomonas haliclonae TaxID=1960125 RepID=A0A1X7AFY6_9GAMM|nr:alkaline phosphatase [Parendozoicomonas haliclonae]SMA38951.1 Alkaline phosphatase precursor [Parendozoicomonas haliclonae]